MSVYEMFILAAALAMDAFAMAVCKGLATRKQVKGRHMLLVGVWFGTFQALMPALGWLLGWSVAAYVDAVDHWIAFFLLAMIGGNMIREATDKEGEQANADFSFLSMLSMAVATSIDALAMGVALAFQEVNILLAVGIIGIVTFVVSAIGVRLGSLFGGRYQRTAEGVGGVILILLGLRIFLTGLG